MEIPSFLHVGPPKSIVPAEVPVWPPPERFEKSKRSKEDKALLKEHLFSQFDMLFPRIMDMVYAGYSLSRAVSEMPIAIDYGQFNRWILKDPQRKAVYEEAQEFRAEVYADRLVAHAEGHVEDATIERSKFAFDVYKFLMSRQSKKKYGETKTVDITHSISITAALEQSKQRVIEAEVLDDNILSEGEYRVLLSGDADEEDNEDDD